MYQTFRPFRLQPPVAASGAWFGFPPELTARSADRIPCEDHSVTWASPFPSRLATTTGRIEFVILRTSRSPSVALHPLSRGHSYFRLRSSNPISTRTCTLLIRYTHKRTRRRLQSPNFQCCAAQSATGVASYNGVSGKIHNLRLPRADSPSITGISHPKCCPALGIVAECPAAIRPSRTTVLSILSARARGPVPSERHAEPLVDSWGLSYAVVVALLEPRTGTSPRLPPSDIRLSSWIMSPQNPLNP